MMIERVYAHKNEELVVTQMGRYRYLVYNRMKGTTYFVDVVYTGRIAWFSCECKAFEYRNRCKHIDAVRWFIEDEELERRIRSVRENTEELMCIED